MRHSSCINGTLGGTEHYSSPVPWIGLYIAAASSVCMFLMIYDISVGFRNRKQWLPCKLFQLNSVTLTLISVVVKLPVDLTSPMPRSLDQLSKLSGTTFLCIYMCYIMPSLGDMKDWTNMYALSILVITVFVNICIQLSTGVIVLFVTQHIIILCCLLVMLLLLWSFALGARGQTSIVLGKCKSYFRSGARGGANFLDRLKVTYLYSFSRSPQFISHKELGSHATAMLSLVCSGGLIWASIRSVVLKKQVLCKEASDYGWSMGIIVLIQFLCALIGSFAGFVRVMTMSDHINYATTFYDTPLEEPYNSNPIWFGVNRWISLRNQTSMGITLCLFCGLCIPVYIVCFLLLMIYSLLVGEANFEKSLEAGEDIIYEGDMRFDQWTLRKGEEQMARVIEASADDLKSFPSSETPLSSIYFSHKDRSTANTYERPRPRDLVGPNEAHKIPLRLLPLVLLVRIAQVSLPNDLSQPIVLAFEEVFEVLYFVEKYSIATIFQHVNEKAKTKVAKAVWMAPNFQHLLPQTFNQLYDSNLDRANAIMVELGGSMPPDTVGTEISFLVDFIQSRNCSSVEALYYFVQDLFVDSLEVMLAQLPRSIFNAVYGSPTEEFDERLRLSLKYLCKFETWDGLIWEPPIACNCSDLLLTEIQAEATDSSNVVPQVRTQINVKAILVTRELFKSISFLVSGSWHVYFLNNIRFLLIKYHISICE